MSKTCETCQHSKPKNQKENLKQHGKGTTFWEKIGTDIFQINGRDYLILVDYYSSFIGVDYLPSRTTSAITRKMKSHFTRYGIPKVIISDCGLQYTTAEFDRFTQNSGIHHEKSSPGNHKSNGKAESAVKIIKSMIKR